MNINTAIEIAARGAKDAYLNGADLDDILRDALLAVGPWIGAQVLRDEADSAEENWREEWDEFPDGYIPEPGITVAELRLRADEIEGAA